ncbi:MAG: sugar kinase, ribokinase family [Caloramator sp.]|jgi:fructokinase|uniref:carbohydrate kinase family protein n=1 Tax=Caloramator sp. TaxID=1871330 RepID=UPI001D734AD7|nr:carbohydrate kinase [Caloramator sp.]MBZ4662671.1 sugar kinase, ribokinase family [Caloramator sp.]
MNIEEKIIFSNREYDLLTVGEILIDMISKDFAEDFSSEEYIKNFGGSPANIVINTKRLGLNSRVVSSVGFDGFGDFLVSHLQNEGIDTSLIGRTTCPTSIVVVTRSRGTPVPIFYRGADYEIEYTEELDKAIKNTRIMHFSTWPLSRERSRKVVEKAIKTAKESGTLIGFDPNYHRDLWDKDFDAIGYIKSIIKYVDFIKPSEDDAERLFGKDIPKNQIKKFLELGADVVVMTLGKDGVIVADKNKMIQFNTLATEVKDTTGAGDAFWSGFYTGMIKGRNIEDAVKVGLAASAFKLKYIGAISPMPRYEELIKQFNV